MKKLIAAIIAVLLLVGCGGSSNKAGKGYTFTYNDVTLTMNQKVDEDILKSLGKYSLFEAPSCAFGDLDRTYTYNSFQIDTYTLNDVQYLKSIVLKDDTVEFEGLCIGSSKSDVVKTLGEEYEEKTNGYVFTKGDSTASFTFAGEVVTNIILDAVVDL